MTRWGLLNNEQLLQMYQKAAEINEFIKMILDEIELRKLTSEHLKN